jgi:hypothetical protein
MSGAKTERPRRQELLEEEGFLRRSLEDLDRERSAGDLDEADYEVLRASYEGRSRAIEAVLEELEAHGPDNAGEAAGPATVAPATTRSPATAGRRIAGRAKRSGGLRALVSSRRHRLVLGWSAVACFAIAGTLAGLALAGVQPFAQSPPLPLSTQIRIELAEAGTLAANHEIVQAVAVYDKVLELDAEQPEALADGGWLLRLVGLSSKSARLVTAGDAEIATAVQVAPGYALARAYDAVALLEDEHSAVAAVGQLQAMLADHPSSTLLFSVRTPALAAYRAAGVALPLALAHATG